MNLPLTRYEEFKAGALEDMKAYQDRLQSDGSWTYMEQVSQLEKLQINMNRNLLLYLFGGHLGEHLAEKFHTECRGNLLFFLRQLTSEYRFFILYELKTNKALFAHT